MFIENCIEKRTREKKKHEARSFEGKAERSQKRSEVEQAKQKQKS